MYTDSDAQEYFASDVNLIMEPYEGLEFESEEAVRKFYNTYAENMGFKARVSSFIRSKRDRTIISRQLVCSREGFRANKESNSEGKNKRPRIITRVGCRAMLMSKKQNNGKWVISKCEKNHNHVLGIRGKAVMLDYDPYERHEEEVLQNPNKGEPYGYQTLYHPPEMVVVPPEGNPNLEPRLGMEFNCENDAQLFYKAYARHVGFRARVSSYYRSKRDNSIISRLIVCSKEGYRAKKYQGSEERLQRPRAITRVGCNAMIMVKRRDSGKWVVSRLLKNHNHELVTGTISHDEYFENEADETVDVETTYVPGNGGTILEPNEGMEFESEEAARLFYLAYSRRVGFNMRVSTYYRSKRDKSVISRLFVCSKEGFYIKKDMDSEGKIKRPQRATRVGCKAMLMVKKNSSDKWVVSKFQKDHNHGLGALRRIRQPHKRKHLAGKTKSSKNRSASQRNVLESPSSRYNNLRHEAVNYAKAGAATPDVYNVAMEALQEAVKKIKAMKKDGGDMLGTGSIVDEDDLHGCIDLELESVDDHTSSLCQCPNTGAKPLRTQTKITCNNIPQVLRICDLSEQPVQSSNNFSMTQSGVMALGESITMVSCERRPDSVGISSNK